MPLSDLQNHGERGGCSRRRPPWDGGHWTRTSGQPSPFFGVKPPQLATVCLPFSYKSRVSFRALPTGSGQKGAGVMRSDPQKRAALQAFSAFLTTLQSGGSLAFESKHIPGLRVSLASPAPAPGRLSWGRGWEWVVDALISISAHQGLLKSAL